MSKDIIKGLDELLKVCRPLSLTSRWNDKWCCMEYRLLVQEEIGQGCDVFVYKFASKNRGLVFVSRERYP